MASEGGGREQEEEDDEEELAPPLTPCELQEVLDGELLSGEHINKFQEIISAFTDFNPRNVFFIGAMEFIKPVRTREHLQILPGRALEHPGDLTHWICVHHDGSVLHVYDSLNACFLSPEQEEFLQRLFPQHRLQALSFEPVQTQPNLVDCGVFAAAFATSVAYDRDPRDEVYVHARMRPHLHELLSRGIIDPFPTFADLDDEYNGDRSFRYLKM